MNLLISLYRIVPSEVLASSIKPSFKFGDLRERQSQVGSLAGAAHLLNDNTGVLRQSSIRTEILCRIKG